MIRYILKARNIIGFFKREKCTQSKDPGPKFLVNVGVSLKFFNREDKTPFVTKPTNTFIFAIYE